MCLFARPEIVCRSPSYRGDWGRGHLVLSISKEEVGSALKLEGFPRHGKRVQILTQYLHLAGSRVPASVVVAHGLSCPKACSIFLDQGLNPFPLIGRQTLNNMWMIESFGDFLDLPQRVYLLHMQKSL